MAIFDSAAVNFDDYVAATELHVNRRRSNAMSSIWVILSYTSAMVLALLLLSHFHARRWYWHALSLGVAFGIGFYSPPEAWRGPTADLAIGWLFTLFLLWAIGAPLFRVHSN